MTSEKPTSNHSAVDSFTHAEAHGAGPAINIVIPEARELATAIHRNGMWMGFCAGVVIVLAIWVIMAINQRTTAASLCAYELNMTSAIARANGDRIDLGQVKCGDE